MTAPMDNAERADLFVLGLLDPAEAAETEARLDTDAALADAVAAARARFAPIDDTVDPVAPSPGLWSRIEAAIDARPPAPARKTVRAAAPPSTERRLKRWRAAALSGFAASALLAVGMGWRVMNPAAPEVIAVLLDDENQPVAYIEDFGGARQRLVSLARPDAPAEATFQVWTKWSDEVGPVSLGVLDELRTATLSGPGAPPPQDGQLYEITLEGPGGSPTGLPTGPIIGIGLGRVPVQP